MKDYIQIRINKKTLESILIVILTICALIIIFGIPFMIGKSIGYDEGFNEGYKYEWNSIVNSLNKGGTVEMVNKDGTTNMSIQKYSPIVFSGLTIGSNTLFNTGSLFISNNTHKCKDITGKEFDC